MCGPPNLRNIFHCRQKLQEQQAALDETPKERETAVEECATTPQMEKTKS